VLMCIKDYVRNREMRYLLEKKLSRVYSLRQRPQNVGG
jgi:hypothetical protein